MTFHACTKEEELAVKLIQGLRSAPFDRVHILDRFQQHLLC